MSSTIITAATITVIILSVSLYKSLQKYAICKVPENHLGMKVNWTYQLITYAYNVALCGENKHYKEKQRLY
jgi:hypothetical protein